MTGGIIAAGLTVGGLARSGAFFTSQATVTGQQVAVASVAVEAGTSASSSPISIDSMLPGDTASTSIELGNTGSEAVYYTVRLPVEAGGDVALEDELEVTVTVGSLSETRTVSAWQDGALQVGTTLDDDAVQAVTITVALPGTAGNALQGTSTAFKVQFDAIQARNTPTPTAGWAVD